MDSSTVKLVTIPVSWLYVGGSAFAGLVVVIAGIIVWLFATFITRTEAGKIEAGVQQLVNMFKELFDEKIADLKAQLDRIDKRHYRGEKPRLKVVKTKG